MIEDILCFDTNKNTISFLLEQGIVSSCFEIYLRTVRLLTLDQSRHLLRDPIKFPKIRLELLISIRRCLNCKSGLLDTIFCQCCDTAYVHITFIFIQFEIARYKRYFQHWHFWPNSSTPSKSNLLCQEQFTLSKSTFTLSE